MRAPFAAPTLLALAACVPPGDADRSAFLPDLPPPAITAVEVACDRDAGRWELEVVTDAWAGGAVLLWTVDGAYVERHDGFRSVRAAADGSRDQLALDVSMVADFRAARNGTTAFSCDERPSLLLVVRDLEGRGTDCVREGEPIAAVEGVPDCPRTVELWPEDDDAAGAEGA